MIPEIASQIQPIMGLVSSQGTFIGVVEADNILYSDTQLVDRV